MDADTLAETDLRLVARTDSAARHLAAITLVERIFPAASKDADEVVPTARDRAMERDDAILTQLWAEDLDDWDDPDRDEPGPAPDEDEDG